MSDLHRRGRLIQQFQGGCDVRIRDVQGRQKADDVVGGGHGQKACGIASLDDIGIGSLAFQTKDQPFAPDSFKDFRVGCDEAFKAFALGPTMN